MKRASFNTTTTYLIVAFGMMTFMFFGINSFLNVTYSADVVSKDLEFLDTIDTAHILKACLEDYSGFIPEANAIGFKKSQCYTLAPGIEKLDFEFQIEDLESEGGVLRKSVGYDPKSEKPTHSISVIIKMEDGETHVGKIRVQAG